MQPLGMPVVTSFHVIRESLFLNTKCKNANAVESVGNFFLTPGQYLFAGKTISPSNHRQDGFEIKQSFNYQNGHLFKALLSLLALPICEPIGISLKGISFLSPTVRERHRDILTKVHEAKLVVSNLEKYRQKGITQLHCDEFIPCQGHKRPSFLTKKQKVEEQALRDIVALLEANEIVHWVDFGTCLGAYRYGGIIPWDWDIDIAIFKQDHDNVKKILSTLDPDKYLIQDWSSYDKPKTLLKLYVKETKNFIDIYHYHIDEKEKKVCYIYTFENSPFPESWKKSDIQPSKSPLAYEQMFPLKKANFDGMTVWVPNHVVEFLNTKYGDNLDPSMVWNEESETYQKVENHPYWALLESE